MIDRVITNLNDFSQRVSKLTVGPRCNDAINQHVGFFAAVFVFRLDSVMGAEASIGMNSRKRFAHSFTCKSIIIRTPFGAPKLGWHVGCASRLADFPTKDFCRKTAEAHMSQGVITVPQVHGIFVSSVANPAGPKCCNSHLPTVHGDRVCVPNKLLEVALNAIPEVLAPENLKLAC